MIENRPEILAQIIQPFEPIKRTDGPSILLPGYQQVIPSYGMAESGYDIRLGREVTLRPGRTTLSVSFELLRMPQNLTARLICKSTLARLGIHLNVTEIDPGFYGRPTLEIGLFPVAGIVLLAIPEGCGIGCLQFHEIKVARMYQGKYQGDLEPREAL